MLYLFLHSIPKEHGDQRRLVKRILHVQAKV